MFKLLKNYLQNAEVHQALSAMVASTLAEAPLTRYQTPSGALIRASMTGLGRSWVSSREGYGYSYTQPITGKTFPTIPDWFTDFSKQTLVHMGYQEVFVPQAVLINFYPKGCTMSPHRDADEKVAKPILCFSLGGSAEFTIGRSSYMLDDGDAYGFWGDDRDAYHGIKQTNGARYAITVRQIQAV